MLELSAFFQFRVNKVRYWNRKSDISNINYMMINFTYIIWSQWLQNHAPPAEASVYKIK